MARESRRKREERRFGRPERLADKILAEGVAVPGCTPPGMVEAVKSDGDVLVRELGEIPIVEASNIADYAVANSRTMQGWEPGDFPSIRPPFAEFWVEGSARLPIVGEPSSFGVLFTTIGRDDAASYAAELVDAADPMGIMDDRSWTGVLCCRIGMAWAQRFYFPVKVSFLFLDDGGRMTRDPVSILSCNEETKPPEDILVEMGCYQLIAMLAVGFMNCKNVTLVPAELPREFNRERKKAGLKPFVRYHTINIEPMKKVLRAEGNIEANGLKKALHIVRGHFTHYGEDKPLFGRPGLHGTFWTPSHIRGSLDQGVVVSDYNVKAPANP